MSAPKLGFNEQMDEHSVIEPNAKDRWHRKHASHLVRTSLVIFSTLHGWCKEV